MIIYCFYYLVLINVITFIAYGIDKLKAKKGKWRIPEATLLLLAIVGGSIGAWCGMKVWHHKTMHKKFRYGIPLIIVVQIGLCLYWITQKKVLIIFRIINPKRNPQPATLQLSQFCVFRPASTISASGSLSPR